jgi:hypothetical protein
MPNGRRYLIHGNMGVLEHHALLLCVPSSMVAVNAAYPNSPFANQSNNLIAGKFGQLE